MSSSTRRLQTGDYSELRDLRLRALAGEPSAFGSTFEREEAFAEATWKDRLAAGGNPHFGGFDASGALVGLAVGMIDPTDLVVAHLVGMWVDPSARRSGLGVELAGLVIDWAIGRGARTVHLWVTGGNHRAEALYAKLGFVRTGHSLVRDRDGLAEIEMALNVTARIRAETPPSGEERQNGRLPIRGWSGGGVWTER